MNTAVSNSAGSILQSFDYYWSRYWIENGDPRINKSPLFAGGPWQMLAITLTYLITVTIFGPYIMRKRKPMNNLLWPIRIYNTFMVFFNAYLYYSFSKKMNWGLDCWGCGKSMKRFDSAGLVIVELTLLSRYFDFFDSLFFVLRKKFTHLSVLHVTHHSIVPVIVWFAGKFEPTPMVVFAGYINLPIHVIMYTYYCLSTFPSLRKYLWWKKYLTTIQIIQFCIDLVHSFQVFYYPSCKFHTLTYIQTAFSITFIYLFGQFYLRSYIAKRRNSFESKSTSSSQLLDTTQINGDQSDKLETIKMIANNNGNHYHTNGCRPQDTKKTV